MKKFYLIGVITFIIGLILGLIILKSFNKPKVIVKTVVKKEIVKIPEKQKINVDKLSEWIYNHSFRTSKDMAEEYAKQLIKTKYPLILTAIIYRESSFNLTAVNKVGNNYVIGLSQILCDKYHLQEIQKVLPNISSCRDLFNYKKNIKAGEIIFENILKKKGNIKDALIAYSGGSKSYAKQVLEILGDLTVSLR